MDPELDGLSRRVSALTSRLADLSAKLADAARGLLESGAPPANAFVDDLASARAEFADLREEVIAAAGRAGIASPPALDSVGTLPPALLTIERAMARRRHSAALEQARAAVLDVLDRAERIVHRTDPTFSGLQACYDKAAEVRAALEAASEPAHAHALTESVRAFAELLTIVEARPHLDAQRCAQIEENIARVFGSTLAAAARSGLLVMGIEAPEVSAPSPADGVESEALNLQAAAAAAQEPETEAELAPPAAPERRFAPRPTVDPGRRQDASAPSASDDSGQWWLAAWARWSGWKSTTSFADAVRDELSKYPFLLSVPIKDSPTYEEGLVAYGYSILLDHVERQTPGSVVNALNRLQTNNARSVGDQLYDYMCTQGRLPETYPAFVRDVLVAALPEPGVWFDLRIIESKDETRIFRRPTPKLGDTGLTPQRLSVEAQRFTAHRFTVTLASFTSRFYLLTVEPTELRAVDVRVGQDGAPSDAAWVVPVAAGKKSHEGRRVPAEGMTVSGLGRETGALWITVFNADPAAAHDYQLTIALRKESRSAFGGKAKARTS